MFRGGQANPYDDIVSKATDENLTGENWELILNLCDKVQEEGEAGARNVVAAILKRLAHRNPNVQLYTLSLAESLSKNLGVEVHREIASKAFTQGLERIVTDRNTHDKVRRKATGLIAMWVHDFEKDPTLGIMEECYETLKTKGYKFDPPEEAPPPAVDDEVRRREEEELQRVLELSMQDKGGRGQWSQYSLASNTGAGGSTSAAASSSTSLGGSSSKPQSAPPQQQQQPQQQLPTYGGYVPSATPATADLSATPSTVTSVTTTNYTPASPVPSHKSSQDGTPVVTRVRALHTFEPTEAGELAFEKGDIIKVVDRGYKDWWRGQLKGRTGIFPVNYVEPLPEPTASELAKEAEQEAAVFNQAVNVDRLLTLLRQMDPTKDNLADNEEIQELYRQCMSLRPKIVKLIDKYSQKRADLVSMNESFVKARTIFDRMMEESLARHSALYEGRPDYARTQSQQYVGRQDGRPDYPPQGQAPYWSQSYEQVTPGYGRYQTGLAPTGPPQGPQSPYPVEPGFAPQPYAPDAHAPPYGPYAPGPQPYAPAPGVAIPFGAPDAQSAYPPQQQPHDVPGYPQQLAQPPAGLAGPQQTPLQPHQSQQVAQQQPYDAAASQQHVTSPPPEAQPLQPQVAQPQIQGHLQAQTPSPLQQPYPQPQVQPQGQQAFPVQSQAQQPYQVPPQAQPQAVPQQDPQAQLQQAVPQAQPTAVQQDAVQQQAQLAHQAAIHQLAQTQIDHQQVNAQPQVQVQTQAEPQVQPHATEAQVQSQAQAQPQPQQQQSATPQQQAGPPFVFDPAATYPDPNVQAWAQYYAQGGTDPTGSVYFISVPGVKEDTAAQQPKSPSRSNTQDGVVAGQHVAAHEQQTPYGASPYSAQPTATDPNAQAWQAQYQNLGNQFAGMNVNGADAGQHGQHGVGTTA